MLIHLIEPDGWDWEISTNMAITCDDYRRGYHPRPVCPDSKESGSEPLGVTRKSAQDVSKTKLSQVQKSKNSLGNRGIVNLELVCYFGAVICFATACHLGYEALKQTLLRSRTPDLNDVKNVEACALLLELRSPIAQIGAIKFDGPFYPEQLKHSILDFSRTDLTYRMRTWLFLCGPDVFHAKFTVLMRTPYFQSGLDAILHFRFIADFIFSKRTRRYIAFPIY